MGTVQPIINYGAGVWGTRDFSCINAVQNRACRFFMGVGKKTPNDAVQAEMGWTSPGQRRWLCVARTWFRLCNMSENRVTKRIFLWAHTRAQRNCKNWIFYVQKCFNELQMNHLSNINYSFDVKQSLTDLAMVLEETNEIQWFNRLQRDTAQRGPGGNKLRTFRLFKSEWTTELYLEQVINKSNRSALAKFRCGVAPLRIETGRYGRNRIPVHQRTCTLCNSTNVEDESHVILKCPLYQDLRDELFDEAREHNIPFDTLSDIEKMKYLLSNCDIVKSTARTLSKILERRKIFFYNI